MNIFEYMSFNLEWFLTVPGMLITLGVVLLLIALIVLITSGKKDNDEEVQNVISNDPNLMNDYNNFAQNQMNVPNMENIQNFNTEPVQVPSFNSVQPVSETNQNSISFQPQANTVLSDVPNQMQSTPATSNTFDNQQIMNEQVMNDANIKEVNIQSQPQIQPQINIPVQPQVDFNQQSETTPTYNIPNVGIPKVEEPSPVQVENTQPSVSIYGGASPISNVYNNEPQAKPVIYGGADPLENTSPIPKVEPTPVVPQFEAKVVEPVAAPEPVIPTPIVSNVEQPIVDNSFNNIVSEQPVQSPLFTTPVQQTTNEQVQNNNTNKSVSEIETLDF